jgi:chorismate dehydratase
VKLLSRVPWQQVDRLALDEGSRTSQALARVWLDAAHGVRPRRVESLALGVSPLESTADAVLVIGDRAMRTTTAGFLASVDLSEAWNSLTGLPFVFAFWVVRPDCEFPELTLHFQLAKALGLHRVHEIAAAASLRLGLPDETCLDYLTRTLSYHLSEPEIAGFDRFHRMAALLDLAPEDVSLVWHGQRHSVTSR